MDRILGDLGDLDHICQIRGRGLDGLVFRSAQMSPLGSRHDLAFLVKTVQQSLHIGRDFYAISTLFLSCLPPYSRF